MNSLAKGTLVVAGIAAGSVASVVSLVLATAKYDLAQQTQPATPAEVLIGFRDTALVSIRELTDSGARWFRELRLEWREFVEDCTPSSQPD